MSSASTGATLAATPGDVAVAGSRPVARAGKLTNLQALRAFAALAVAFHHAGGLLVETRGDHRYLDIFNFNLGAFGVALFFAMSGFLMAHLVRNTDPMRFLAHRIARLYPIFFVVVAFSHGLMSIAGTPISLRFTSLILAPVGPHIYLLGVEWSLLYEITFYVMLFGLALVGLSKRVEAFAVAWLVLIGAASVTGLNAEVSAAFPRFPAMLMSEVNVAFAGGMLIPAIVRRGWLPTWLCAAAIPVSVVALWAGLDARWPTATLVVLVTAAAVQLPQFPVDRFAARAVVRLGDWSYALYLLHMSLMAVLFKLAPASLSSGALFLIGIALSLVATAILGQLDTTIYRHLRGAVERVPRRPLAILAVGFTVIYLATAIFNTVQLGRAEAVDDRARAAIARLPAGSLADPAALVRGVDAPGLHAPDTFAAGFDRVDHLDIGQMLAVGWAVDTARPDASTRMALVCGGKIVVLARPERYRPDVATRFDRREIGRHRIGYTAALKHGQCPAGAPVMALFVDGSDRMLAGQALSLEKP